MNRTGIAVYYFPNYHSDFRNRTLHGDGWNEWVLTKKARSRFPGHKQPKIPLWGYEDEADPAVMTRKIEAASSHGIDAFLFDWYYYDDGPFLERALTEGFRGASNSDRLSYALMWANHNWVDIHPLPVDGRAELLYPGAVTRKTFDCMTDYIIETHFRHPSYWKIDGCPYFSIYEIYRLAEGLGGWENAKLALERFRVKTRAAGFPDLHLNAVLWGVQILPGEQTIGNPAAIVKTLKFDSVTSYVWIHHARLEHFPLSSYRESFEANRTYWHKARDAYRVPYFPNVTVGWDSSPRTLQDQPFVNSGYPFSPVMDTSPQEFRAALRAAREFVSALPVSRRIVTINAWNEWTEGSYLEPDLEHGYAYLEAIAAEVAAVGRR